MRILQIIDTLRIGGAEDVVTNMSIGFSKNGHDVAILLLSKKEITPNIKKLSKTNVKLFFLKEKKYSLASIKEAKYIVKMFNPEIIQSQLSGYYYAFILRKVGGAKRVHTIHNTYLFDSGIKGRIFHKLFLRQANAIVAVSSSVAKTIKNYGKNIFIMLNCTEIFSLSKTKKTSLDKINKNLRGEVIFLNVANFRPEKNHLLLIRSFALLKKQFLNAKLIIAGEGIMRANIEKEICNLGLKNDVYLLGRRNDIPEILKASDIFVLTSKSEGLPLVLLEAMVAKLPIISTKAGGTIEIVKNNKNGYLVDSDEKSISEAMLKLARSGQLRLQFGSASRSLVKKKYSVEIMIKNYLKLYKKILRK